MPVVTGQTKITSDRGWGQIMRVLSRKLPAGFARIGTRGNQFQSLRRRG